MRDKGGEIKDNRSERCAGAQTVYEISSEEKVYEKSLESRRITVYEFYNSIRESSVPNLFGT